MSEETDDGSGIRPALRRAFELFSRGDAAAAEAAVLRPVVEAEQAEGASSAAFLEAVNDLGRYLLLAGEPERAAEALRRGSEGPISKDPRAVQARFACLTDLAEALRATGEWEEAETVLRDVLERREARFGRRGVGYADGLVPLAELLLAEERYGEALPLAEEAGLNYATNADPRFLPALALRAEILAHLDRPEPLFPPVSDLPEQAVAILAEVVWSRLSGGDDPAADQRVLEALLPALEARLGEDSDTVLLTLSRLAEAERQLGAEDGAPERRQVALRRLAESFARRGEPAQVLAALQGLALAESEAGETEAAIATYREADRRAEALGDPIERSRVLRNFGLHLAEAGRDPEAEARLRDALNVAEGADETARARAHAQIALGIFLMHHDRAAEAAPLLESAVATLDPDDPDALTARRYLDRSSPPGAS